MLILAPGRPNKTMKLIKLNHRESNRRSIEGPIEDPIDCNITTCLSIGSSMGSQRVFNRKGFTLVEMILYVTIVSIFFLFTLGFFWQARGIEVRADISREVKENVGQLLEIFKYFVRDAEGVNAGGSQFGVHPGVLELVYSDGNRIFDTYTKDLTVGGVNVTIRKLRYTHSGSSYDLTSDHVDVTTFRLSDLTQGSEPFVTQMELDLESVNPGNDPNYDNSLSVRTTANVREEI